MSARRLVVDTDTGIDDAHALLYLLGLDVEIVAITTIFGNAATADVAPNVRRVLDVAGVDVPVAVGADAPLEGVPHIAGFVHGLDGLGDLWPEKRQPRTLLPDPAHQILLDLPQQHPGELDLLLLGPLTNAGLALKTDPDLFTRYRRVVTMGGVGPFPELGQPRGIDPNTSNDRVAADLVYSAPATDRVMVGSNVTRSSILDEDAMARLAAAGTPIGDFTHATLQRYLDFYQHLWGRRVSCAHDAAAAAVLLDPTLVTGSWEGPVNVITDGGGLWRAQAMVTADGVPPTISTRPVPSTTVCAELDQERLVGGLLDVLARPAS